MEAKLGTIKLDIGAGAPNWQRKPLEEWIHLDAIAHPHIELVQEFVDIPLPDGACKEIYIGDIIEHIPQWRYDEVLKEWNRVLMMGGIVKGTCPNGDRAMKLYSSGEISFDDAKLALYGWAINATETHFNCFTKETLTELFEKHGFEVKDYSGSPGNEDMPWWLVFVGTKVRNG